MPRRAAPRRVEQVAGGYSGPPSPGQEQYRSPRESRMSKRVRPEVVHGGWALALGLAGVAVLFAVFHLPPTWYHLLAAWLVVVNLVAFAYYGYDKAQARSGGRRVPEAVLLGLGLAG